MMVFTKDFLNLEITIDMLFEYLFFKIVLFSLHSLESAVNLQISGSVIKHQLISSLTLGMALRLVLDSLRKPADSKVWILL